MSPQLINEIRDLNLSYLLLAQDLIRQDIAAAMSRLAITQAVAEQIGQLSPEQLLRVASRNMVLCTLRFNDQMVLGLLGDSHVQGAKPLAPRLAPSARTRKIDLAEAA